MSWQWRTVSDLETALPEFIRIVNQKLNQLASLLVAVVPLTVTATTTTGTGDTLVFADATAGAVTVVLPTAVGDTAERVIKKIDASANAVTVDGAGTQTIDGALTKVLAAQWDHVRIISNGTNWMIV